jgi:regulator of cell morphogenesis and NO signaling
MMLTPESTVAEIATAAPAAIAVFQQHQIDFCCGGRVPLAQACRARGLDVDDVLAELRAAVTPADAEPNWADASATALVRHIQKRYHDRLRVELPRLGAMLKKVVSRHGDRLPEKLRPLQHTFETLQAGLLAHLDKEDQVLFPVIVRLENGSPQPAPDVPDWMAAPIAVMEAEHEDAGATLKFIREVTDGFAPPEWACPTFRGLYYGLSQLEAEMHVHVHLENNVLFPRAAALCSRYARARQAGANPVERHRAEVDADTRR